MPWISVENSTLMWCIFLNCFSFHFLGFFCTSFLGAECFILFYNLNIHQAIPSANVKILDKSILSTHFLQCSPYLAGWLTVIKFCRSITFTKRGWIQLVSFLMLLSQMPSINQRFVLCDDMYKWFSVIGIVLHTVQCYL